MSLNSRFFLQCMSLLMALLGPREMSDLSPQGGPKRTLLWPRKFLRCMPCTNRTMSAGTISEHVSQREVTMQLSKAFALAFTVVSVLFAVLLSLSTGTLNARDADFASRTFAAAHTVNRKCINTCRARYRDCLSLKQIPSSECRGIYQDCTRYTCNAGPGRPSWPGFPS